jgi:hypothetical protein
MCLWSQWSLQWLKPCKINQTRMFGCLFNQTIVHMAQCGEAMLLPLKMHPSKQWFSTWPMKSQIINSHIIVCSLNFAIFGRSHLDSIEFGAHHQTNLWQAHNNLVGMYECWKSHNEGWLHSTTKHHIFGLIT